MILQILPEDTSDIFWLNRLHSKTPLLWSEELRIPLVEAVQRYRRHGKRRQADFWTRAFHAMANAYLTKVQKIFSILRAAPESPFLAGFF